MEIFSFHRRDGEGDAKDDDGDEDSIFSTLACFDLVITEMTFLIRKPLPLLKQMVPSSIVGFRLPSQVDDDRVHPYRDDEMIIIFIHE